jgi:hypothetical protein
VNGEDAGVSERLAFGEEVRNMLRVIGERLEAVIDAEPDDQRKSVHVWHLVLTTMAYDVSEAALSLGAQGSVRAARMLNRSLTEYAFRAHQYRCEPGQAEEDMAQAPAMARKLMLPTRNIMGHMTPDEHAKFKAYLDAGPSKVTLGRIRDLMIATLTSLAVGPKTFDEYVEWLQVEYTLGSGLLHGDMVGLLDVFRKGEENRAERGERSLHFVRQDELIRTITALILLIAAIELFNDADLGGRQMVKRLDAGFFGKQRHITVWQHNALLPLLGVRRS